MMSDRPRLPRNDHGAIGRTAVVLALAGAFTFLSGSYAADNPGGSAGRSQTVSEKQGAGDNSPVTRGSFLTRGPYRTQGQSRRGEADAPSDNAATAADPSEQAIAALVSGDGLEADDARRRLRIMLRDLDQRAAREMETADKPVAVAELAELRAAYAAALSGVERLSDEAVIDLEAKLPIAGVWPAIAGRLDATTSGTDDSMDSGTASDDSVEGITQSEQDELEQIRADWHAIFDRYESWAPLTAPDQADYLEWISNGRTAIDQMTYEDLASLRDELSYVPNWRVAFAPDIIGILTPPGGTLVASVRDTSTGQPDAVDTANSAPDGAVSAEGGAAPDGSLSFPGRGSIDAGGQCTDHALNMTVDQVIARQIAEAVLRGVSLGIKLGVDIAPKDIKILIFGAAVDIPNPITFLLQIGKAVVNRVADGLAADVAVAGICQSTVHWQLTRIHAQSFVERSQAQMAQIVTHHNDMTGRLNTVDHTQRELWKLQLQLAIEENLLEEGPLPDGSNENRIALFQWLETVCFNPEELLPTPRAQMDQPVPPTPRYPIEAASANNPLPTVAPFVGPPDPVEECGLNLVRRLLVETIDHNQQAGNNIHNALSLLAAGDSLKANQDYAGAYLRYRQSYQAAVKPDPEPTQ